MQPELHAYLQKPAGSLTWRTVYWVRRPWHKPEIPSRRWQAFNAGADALDRLSEADSLQALELLEEAAEKFEQALDADAFDDEAHRWLAHVYEILAERFRREDAIQDQLRVLHRLVARNQDRHDYIALLGSGAGTAANK